MAMSVRREAEITVPNAHLLRSHYTAAVLTVATAIADVVLL